MFKERFYSFKNKREPQAEFKFLVDGRYYNQYGFDRFGNCQTGRHITNRNYCERDIDRSVAMSSLNLIEREINLINTFVYLIKYFTKLFIINIFAIGVFSMLNYYLNVNNIVNGLTYLNILILILNLFLFIFKMLFCSIFLYRSLHIIVCDLLNKEKKMLKLFYEFDLIRVLIKYEVVILPKEALYNYKRYYGMLSRFL